MAGTASNVVDTVQLWIPGDTVQYSPDRPSRRPTPALAGREQPCAVISTVVVVVTGDEETATRMRSVKECLKMGCWTVIKSFHVKIILLDKQELIQEIQVREAAIKS